MKYLVEVNNKTGAFQILIFDTQSTAMNFISNINKGTKEHGLIAYNRGSVNS